MLVILYYDVLVQVISHVVFTLYYIKNLFNNFVYVYIKVPNIRAIIRGWHHISKNLLQVNYC